MLTIVLPFRQAPSRSSAVGADAYEIRGANIMDDRKKPIVTECTCPEDCHIDHEND